MARKTFTRRSAEEKKEQVQELLNKLDEGVKNFVGNPEAFKALLEMSALMPTYSFNNIVLILAQRKNARFVAPFSRWKELNRHVRKGEKAIRILAPRFKKETNENTGVEETKLIGFINVPVFDIAQTEGEPLPIDEFKLKLHGESDEAARIFQWTMVLAEEDDCQIHIANANGANGYYSPAKHEIVIEANLSPNHKAKTAVHELVHSRVHRYCSKDTTSEEMECVAEGVAFIVCSYFGLDTSDYSFAYVKGWTEETPEAVMKYGRTIQSTAQKMIEDFERVSTALTTTIKIVAEEDTKIAAIA